MRAALLVLALAAAGCDPGMAMRGSVHAHVDHCAGGIIYAEGEPIANAEVRVQCVAEDEPRLEATTDMAGRFKAVRVGILPMDCSVRVSAQGHRAVHFRVGDVCAVYSDMFQGCHGFSLDVELTPDPRAQPNLLEL